MDHFNESALKKLPYILIFLSFTGCGIWENFTTYFNLYYNTKDIFERAESTIYQEKKPLFSTNELIIPGSVNQDLTKVIEKCSALLQFHSESSYVDNALLMLGKCFYYQKNYQKALRKFQELLATQPESDLVIDTRLWIGKTQMKLRDYENALSTLQALRTPEIDADDYIIRDSYAEEIKFRIAREEYTQAVEALKEFLNSSANDEDMADIYFELGNLYVLLNQMDDAISAYEEVSDYSPSYEVEFQTKIELGKALRETERHEEAFEIFEVMGYENKYSESFDVIELEKGITLKELNDYEEAVNSLKMVDTSYSAKPSAAAARYHLGEIYETYYKNFDSASAYYQKVVSSAAPQEYVTKANDKSQLFKKYNQLNNTIKENRKKLLYIENPEEFVKDSIAFFSALSDSAEADQENRDLGADQNERGNLRREGSRNVRGTETTIQQVQKEKNIPPQRPNISADSVKSILIKNKYELGNLFFTEFNLLDSASVYYEGILTEYPNSPYEARILYALGSYYEVKNEPRKADSLYNFIYDNYKNESIVNAAAVKLKKPLIDLEFDPAKDLYTEAEEYLINEDYKTSLDKFLDISSKFPKSSFAAKAMYTGGWIMENKLNMYDSAAAVYDSLIFKYPQTVYASDVKPKLNYYRQEQIRIKKAMEDSLKNVHINSDSSANSDSLKLIKDLPADSLSRNNGINNSSADNESNIISGPAVADSLKRKEILKENPDVRKNIK